MKQGIFFLLLSTMLSSCLAPANAAYKDEGNPTDIQVEIGKVTEAVFPAEVAKVVKGGVPDALLVEVINNSVYLLPKTKEVGNLFVTTVSGISYPLTLHLGNDHDLKVNIGFKRKLNGDYSRGFYFDEMDLMRDLLLHKEPVGSSLLPGHGKVFLSNKEIEVTIDKAYEISHWKAYVFIAKNLIQRSVILPIEQVSLPNLVAISSDRDMLLARGQEGDTAKVYMIVGQ